MLQNMNVIAMKSMFLRYSSMASEAPSVEDVTG